MVVASWGVDLTATGFRWQVPVIDFGLDGRVLAFSVVITVATGLRWAYGPRYAHRVPTSTSR
jgi:hypothetical protein